MSRYIEVSDLAKVIEPLTGVPLDSLAELHIAAGQITFVTTPNPATGNRDVGIIHIQPDSEPEEPQTVEDLPDEVPQEIKDAIEEYTKAA